MPQELESTALVQQPGVNCQAMGESGAGSHLEREGVCWQVPALSLVGMGGALAFTTNNRM